ncbi:MAG: hypothetical protein ACP5K9_02320 [Candidatus Micrarchaeia archaeon]
MALNEVDTSITMRGIKLDAPIFVVAKSAKMASSISSMIKGIPVVAASDKERTVYVNGTKAKLGLEKYKFVEVKDGIEAAKAIRISKKLLPFVYESETQRIKILVKQLQVAMFLTDSGNINALRKAPIYKME